MFDGLYDDPFYILASSQSGGILQSSSGQAAVVTLLSFPGTHIRTCRMGTVAQEKMLEPVAEHS